MRAVGRRFSRTAFLGVAFLLASCSSAQDDGYAELRAIKVPEAWLDGAGGTGGDWSFEIGYRYWTFEYGPTTDPVDAVRQTYDEALRAAGWAWNSTCEATLEYSSDVPNGCWRLDDYLLVYRVSEEPGRHVDTDMFRDN
ncbi:hypothetical protein [Actinoplanes sp. HUAS TT8]|uniref:hypothetical protein n=1 Tax=Actinoplanes sp. HUAS TT8 TaxID=3447453 RepID=UPI003F528942